MPDTAPACVACGRTDADTPLVPFTFRGYARHICTQHLPVLIHKPDQLAAMLPGAEGLDPAEHED